MTYDETYDVGCESCTIRTHPLFRHLGPEELQEISLSKITETYERASVIYEKSPHFSGIRQWSIVRGCRFAEDSPISSP